MEEGGIKILDQSGKPMRDTSMVKAEPRQPRLKGIAGGNGLTGSTPYDSADMYGQRMGTWNPFLWSPDGEINIWRDRIVSRSRDITRNDGWASGTITRTLDNIIGGMFRPIVKPDYRALQAYTGNKAFDDVWAEEYARQLEAHYRTWANDPNHYNDAARIQTVSQQLYLAMRHELIDGDGLATVL